ncbi:ABC transporter substrate-binding protein [Salinisphaera sp. Q1T1-3]|uniref:ABC transporter substrate-binding protein n=1 Tax=Salinisphaera sp. Q1T1-3 TaxID=2321229 RepID=UPI001314027D|nr:ABC transporter substrate-binding protein [Salinisphaera sp. Q1T1-3]
MWIDRWAPHAPTLVFGLLLLCLAGPATAREIVDATGTQVDVPEQPQRVLALGERDLGAALALEVTPVGRLDGRGMSGAPRYLGPAAEQIPSLGQFLQPAMGRVIEAGPDLILAGGFTDARLIAQLRRIAPTVVTSTHDDDWKQSLERVAAALGRPDRLHRFMQRYQDRVAALRAELGDRAGETVSIVRWNPRGPMTMQRDAFASQVLADVGLSRPPSQQQPGSAHTRPLSLEAMRRLNADWLYVGLLDAAPEAALAEARRSAAFRTLPVVENGHAFGVDGALWTSRGGPLAALAILDTLQRTILGS